MSSVELEVIHVDVGTAEDDHRKDVLKWGFKPVDSSRRNTFLWAENGRLWADTLTVHVAQPSVPITQSLNNPSLTAANNQILVRASLPRQELTYTLPYRRVAVGVHDRASRSHHIVNVNIENGGIFRLHIDTGSPISWVCGFDRGPHKLKFDLKKRPGIPGTRFEVGYADDTHVRGILCNARAIFSNGAFRLNHWTFGVATSANDKMLRAPANEGVLGLSYHRPPGGSSGTNLHPGHEAETFIESLIHDRQGLILALTFCVKLRRRSPGIITFGELPDIGSEYVFQDAVGGRWALPSKRIGIIDSRGREVYKNYNKIENRPNAALLDTGAAKIYIDNDAVNWLYNALLRRDDFKTVDGTRYIEPDAVSKLRGLGISFYLGEGRITLPAGILQGKYSHEQEAYAGTIQGKSGGPTVDDAHWTFDIMGTEFFRHFWIAFDTNPTRPRIAINLNSYDEYRED